MGFSSVIPFFLHISPGWVALTVLAALAFFDSIRGGTARTSALALAFPLSYVLLQFVGSATLMSGISKQFSSSLAQGLFAFLVLGILFVLMYRVTESFGGDVGALSALSATLGLVILTALFWELIPAFNSLFSPGAQIAAVFGEAYRFWWFLAAAVLLAFSKA